MGNSRPIYHDRRAKSVDLGHVVPFSGHGITLAVGIFRFLKARGWDKDALVFGCNGTNPNVGSLQGCLAYLEKLLGHAVHWEICLLLRKPVKFARIKNDSFPLIPEEIANDLSFDQEYLYDICWAIIEGRMDEELLSSQPGALCHS